MPEQRTSTSPLPSYIPALDGVRGVAILLVLVFHGFYLTNTHTGLWLDRAVGAVTDTGWMGVDLFFVLSGFLITRILLDARAGGSYFRSFYARRFLRIFPLYYGFLILLIVVLPIFPPFHGSDGIARLREHQFWYWTYLYNTWLPLHPLADLGPFGNGHLWSLCVEEQFYVIWPAIVLVLSRRNLALFCVLCMAGAPALRLALNEGYLPRLQNGFASYTLMPARVDSLAAGALIAAVARDTGSVRRLARYAPPAGAAGLAVVLGLFAANRGLPPFDEWVQVLGFSALAITFASLLTATVAAAPGSFLHTIGTHRALTFFGRYSYAMYVFHYQIASSLAVRIDTPRVAGSDLPGRLAFTAVVIGLTVAASWTSWHLLESQFLKLKRFVPYGTRATRSAAREPAATESATLPAP